MVLQPARQFGRLLFELADTPFGAECELAARIRGALKGADQVVHPAGDLVDPPLDGLLVTLMPGNDLFGRRRQAGGDELDWRVVGQD